MVIRSDRPRDVGPKSDVISLTQQFSTNDLLRQMGDRVDRSIPAEILRLKASNESKKRKQDQTSDMMASSSSSTKKQKLFRQRQDGLSTLLSDIDTLYSPLSQETKDVYDILLTEIRTISGVQEYDVLRELAHDTIRFLLDTEVNVVVKQRAITKLLKLKNDISMESFSRMYNISQKITDFNVQAAEGEGATGADGELQETTVSIDIRESTDKNEDDDEQNPMSFFVVDQDDDGETRKASKGFDDDGIDLFDPELDGMIDMMDEDEFETKAKTNTSTKTKTNGEDTELNPLNIDAYWLERQLQHVSKTLPQFKSQTPEFDADQDTSTTKNGENEEKADPTIISDISQKILELLENTGSKASLLEASLVRLLGINNFALVKMLLKNRWSIVFCIKYHRASNLEEKAELRHEIQSHASLSAISDALFGSTSDKNVKNISASTIASRDTSSKDKDIESPITTASSSSAFWKKPSRVIDLEELEIASTTPNLTPEVVLPENATSIQKKGYQEIHIPPARAPPMSDTERLIPISEIPTWASPAFRNMSTLNRIQSNIYQTALYSPENMLVCAPTGAGKTNCAMLTIIREIGKARVSEHDALASNLELRDQDDHDIPALDLDSFKVVYIAPMKSLVQEMVLNFTNRLQPYGITVRELSGDVQLTRREIADTQVIVTTPEKWDIITRKDGESRSITRHIKLVIVDEVHLLHDSRGPVIESIIARIHRQTESWLDHIRIVGLSATLPNYEDVALFLRVKPETGLFHFSNAYRPCPLQQQFIGITHKRAVARQEAMNTITYEKTIEQLTGDKKNQVIIFVHSRKETIATARLLRDMAQEQGIQDVFLNSDVDVDALELMLKDVDAKNPVHPALKELIPYGIGFHHAGMSRQDRSMVEELFAKQQIMVLVSTATLAWGVNLPAHTVIIKGTQIYSPEKGRWVELSPQDITQMIGRAGRPQYDTYGEGIVITNHSHMIYYLALMNSALPIESQFLQKMVDIINAEIVAGTITSIHDGVQYLSYTFLYIRMLQMQNYHLYGLSFDIIEKDPELEQYRIDIMHSTALQLAKYGLIRYDRKSGAILSRPLGKIASYYYLSYQSAYDFSKTITANMNDVDLFRAFSFAQEFSQMSVRGDEKMEIIKLLDRVPIPVRENPETAQAKANVLLQVYISRQSIEGFALNSDLALISQSAGRIARAIFEICLANRWANSARRALLLCKMIQRRMWPTMSPLRQFNIQDQTLLQAIQRLERLELSWNQCIELEESVLPEILRLSTSQTTSAIRQKDSIIKKMYQSIHQVPHVELAVEAQPMSSSSISVSLTVTCDFLWSKTGGSDTIGNVGGSKAGKEGEVTAPISSSEGFWLIVEDADGTNILHSEYVTLRQENRQSQIAQGSYSYFFLLPVTLPLPPHFMIRFLSDKWFGADTSFPISLRKIILPASNPPPTKLCDLQPYSIDQLQNMKYMKFFLGQTADIQTPTAREDAALLKGRVFFQYFNPIQTQVFDSAYYRNENLFLAAPVGSGKGAVAELTIMNMLSTYDKNRFTQQLQLQGSQDQDYDDDDPENDTSLYHARCVYLTPFDASAKRVNTEWSVLFDKYMNIPVRLLTGDAKADATLFAEGTIIVSTYDNWYNMSQKWTIEPTKKNQAVTSALLRSVKLCISSDLHFLNDPELGPLIELAMIRLRYHSTELNSIQAEVNTTGSASTSLSMDKTTISGWLNHGSMRLVATSVSIANANELGDWLHCKSNIYAFDSESRPSPLSIQIRPIDTLGAEARQLAITRSIYRNIVEYAPNDPVLIFTPYRRNTTELAVELASMISRHSLEVYEARTAHDSSYIPPTQEQIQNGTVLPVLLGIDDISILQPHLEYCTPAIAELLVNGIGVYHDGLTSQEKRIIQHLYTSRVLQVIVADSSCCFELHNSYNSSLVIIADTQKESHLGDHRYSNIKISSLLHMIGRANVVSLGRTLQSRSNAIVYCTPSQKSFLDEYLTTPYTIESYLDTDFDKIINSLVVSNFRNTRHGFMDFLSWSFLFRRLRKNPHFYRLPLPTHSQVSDFFSDMIDSSIKSLIQMNFISYHESDMRDATKTEADIRIMALNLGIVAEHFKIAPHTIEIFHTAITATTTASSGGGGGVSTAARFGILELVDVLTCAHEMDVASIKPREASSLRKIGQYLPLPITANSTAIALLGYDIDDIYNCTPSKINVLLQSHLSRLPLAVNAQADLRNILPITTRLIAALMNIASSASLLAPVLVGLEFTQMITMAVWGLGVAQPKEKGKIHDNNEEMIDTTDSSPILPTLLQIPHVSFSLATLLISKYNVTSVSDFLELDDPVRAQLLLSSWGVSPGANGKVSLASVPVESRPLLKKQMNEVASFCNIYPDLDVSYDIITSKDDIIAGDFGEMMVTLRRAEEEDEDEDEDEDDEDKDKDETPIVIAPLYPEPKVEAWMIVLGCTVTNELWAMKRVVLQKKEMKVKVPFRISEKIGKANLKLFIMSDSYIGADKEYDVVMNVLEEEEEEEEDEDDE